MQQDNPLDDLKGKDPNELFNKAFKPDTDKPTTSVRLDILDMSKNKSSIKKGKSLSDLLSNTPNKADNTPDKEYEWPIKDSKADQDRKNWEQLKKPQPWRDSQIEETADKRKQYMSEYPITPQEAYPPVKHPTWYNKQDYIAVRIDRPVSAETFTNYGYISREELERIVTEIMKQ
jgi:hypothetical protein